MHNYDLSAEKREIQEEAIPLVKQKHVVALAGPNLVSYTKMFPPTVKEVQIWENKAEVMLTQLEQLARLKRADGRRFDFRYGDIIKAKVTNKSFYDLDFCCNVVNASLHLDRFSKCNFCATLCVRPMTFEEALSGFLIAVGEKKKIDIPHRQFNLLKTNKSQYLYTTYHDSVAMMTIFKLS